MSVSLSDAELIAMFQSLPGASIEASLKLQTRAGGLSVLLLEWLLDKFDKCATRVRELTCRRIVFSRLCSRDSKSLLPLHACL